MAQMTAPVSAGIGEIQWNAFLCDRSSPLYHDWANMISQDYRCSIVAIISSPGAMHPPYVFLDQLWGHSKGRCDGSRGEN